MKFVFLILFSISALFCYAQEGLHFSSDKQFYLKGNSVLIGNNIVSTDATKPFNDDKAINDLLKLKYIDIDNDASTFSSSQANLMVPGSSKKIKYAALYWSAVYKYDKGIRKIINREKMVYKGKDERSKNINSIMLKLPQGNYQSINGKIIFDSYTTELFDGTKPYVCYANITSLLQSSKTINGNYTVANIRATEGYVSGGASGGWLLYVIYESATETPKYFTTYNGFVGVDKTATDIEFNNFKTNEVGEIKTSLLLGVLEGDQKYKTDHCSILNADTINYTPLTTKHRLYNNFFNSTITMGDDVFMERVPNSTNTLGFDLLKMSIPNTNNSILSNNSSHTTIRFKTKADGFYLFFVAFETEISPIYLEEKSNEGTLAVFDNFDNNDSTDIKEEHISETEVLEVTNETLKEKPKKKSGLEKIKNIKSISIPNIPKGYYLVTNVFSVKENAIKWMNNLEEKGHRPKSYVNPKNGWYYIYLETNQDAQTIYLKQKELSKLKYFESIWILKINF